MTSHSRNTLTRRTFTAAALGGTALWSLGAHAQQAALPKTLRILVAYPTGGVSDVVARALAERLASQLGITVVVENKAGASGAIAMDMAAKAPADGSVLCFAAVSPLVLTPHLTRTPYDPLKDIVPVASVMDSPVLILATPATRATDLRTLLAQAQAQPGAVRWATSGQASLGHIMLERLRIATKVDITHVPYKGGGQQLNDALGGQFEVLSTNAGPTLAPHVRSGKLRPLAVGAPRRMESLPDAPTLAELGFAEANLFSRFGLFAPARTPAALVARYNAEVNKALAAPELRERLTATDNLPTPATPEAFARQIAREHAANGQLVRALGIKGE